jgi:hypothetical protein
VVLKAAVSLNIEAQGELKMLFKTRWYSSLFLLIGVSVTATVTHIAPAISGCIGVRLDPDCDKPDGGCAEKNCTQFSENAECDGTFIDYTGNVIEVAGSGLFRVTGTQNTLCTTTIECGVIEYEGKSCSEDDSDCTIEDATKICKHCFLDVLLGVKRYKNSFKYEPDECI